MCFSGDTAIPGGFSLYPRGDFWAALGLRSREGLLCGCGYGHALVSPSPLEPLTSNNSHHKRQRHETRLPWCLLPGL